jgi:hypothetical protein
MNHAYRFERILDLWVAGRSASDFDPPTAADVVDLIIHSDFKSGSILAADQGTKSDAELRPDDRDQSSAFAKPYIALRGVRYAPINVGHRREGRVHQNHARQDSILTSLENKGFFGRISTVNNWPSVRKQVNKRLSRSDSRRETGLFQNTL